MPGLLQPKRHDPTRKNQRSHQGKRNIKSGEIDKLAHDQRNEYSWQRHTQTQRAQIFRLVFGGRNLQCVIAERSRADWKKSQQEKHHHKRLGTHALSLIHI